MINKEFLKFLVLTQIKRKMLVLEMDINYEKQFLDRNKDVKSETINEKEMLIKNPMMNLLG